MEQTYGKRDPACETEMSQGHVQLLPRKTVEVTAWDTNS